MNKNLEEKLKDLLRKSDKIPDFMNLIIVEVYDIFAGKEPFFNKNVCKKTKLDINIFKDEFLGEFSDSIRLFLGTFNQMTAAYKRNKIMRNYIEQMNDPDSYFSLICLAYDSLDFKKHILQCLCSNDAKISIELDPVKFSVENINRSKDMKLYWSLISEFKNDHLSKNIAIDYFRN